MVQSIEYLSAASFVISLLLAIVSFFLIRTLNKIDNNQKQLYDNLAILSKDFYHMKGQHDFLTKGATPMHQPILEK